MCLLISVVSLHLAELNLWEIIVSKVVLLVYWTELFCQVTESNTNQISFIFNFTAWHFTGHIGSVICIADPSDARSVVPK